ncbi:hypothetical protein [Proteus hauseri]|uniref:hypothetical protein n=1 Tax=Proteus hauseri TaxID=183417 RepID=UPI0032DB04BA
MSIAEKEINNFINSDTDFFHMMSIVIKNDIIHAGKVKPSWISEDMSNSEIFNNFDNVWLSIESVYLGDFQTMITRHEKSPNKDEIKSTFKIIKNRMSDYSSSSQHIMCYKEYL